MKYGRGIIYRMSAAMAAEMRADYEKDKRFKNATLEQMVDNEMGLLRPCEKVEVV